MGYVPLFFNCVFRCIYHYFSTYRNCVNQWSKGNFSSTQNRNITFQTLELLISLALMQYSSQIIPLCWPCLISPRRPTSRAPYTWRNPPYILADYSWKKPSSFWNRDHLSLLMKVLVCPCPSGKVRPVCQEIWHKLQGLARPGERPTGNDAKQTFLCTSFYNLKTSLQSGTNWILSVQSDTGWIQRTEGHFWAGHSVPRQCRILHWLQQLDHPFRLWKDRLRERLFHADHPPIQSGASAIEKCR